MMKGSWVSQPGELLIFVTNTFTWILLICGSNIILSKKIGYK